MTKNTAEVRVNRSHHMKKIAERRTQFLAETACATWTSGVDTGQHGVLAIPGL